MAISPRRMLSKQGSGSVATPRICRKNTRICMELVWSLYGACMELVWNMYGTTRSQHAYNPLSTPYQPGGRPFLLSFSMAQGFGQGSDRSECGSEYANTHCNSNGGGRTPGGGGGFGRGLACVASEGRD